MEKSWLGKTKGERKGEWGAGRLRSEAGRSMTFSRGRKQAHVTRTLAAQGHMVHRAPGERGQAKSQGVLED